MNRKLATTALLIGALTLPALAFAEDKDQDRSSPKAWVKDSVITTKIKAEMVKDPAVSATHIKVDTDANGVVQLSGSARSQAEIDKAVSIAQNTKGVSSVQNKITINNDR
jgi:hyperosmotically inducible protein